MAGFLLIAALVGSTLIVVRSAVFQPVRKVWPALFECSQCTGMWVGVLAGVSGLVSVDRGRLVDALVVGAATSVLSLAADALLLNLLGCPDEEEKTT